MASELPQPDEDLGAGVDQQAPRMVRLEHLTEEEIVARKHRNRAADQRFWLRWLSVAVTLSVIALMAAALYRAHPLFIHNASLLASPAYIVALLITPIVSMTALSIALLVAAFRGYKETDEDESLKSATDLARSSELAG